MMKGKILTEEMAKAFEKYLRREEKSDNTVKKYLRDMRAFAAYLNGAEVTKETVITFKSKLLGESYSVRSINSMLASLNGLFSFLGWEDCRVKSVKLQRQIYCPEEKELTKAEYMRLVDTAKQNIQSGAVFITRTGKPMNRTNIWREMKGLCKQAGVNPKKVFPHNLRHLFARTFYGIEKDIAKLADILGHSSINTTRIYIISTGSEHRRRMEHMRLII